MTQQEIIHGCKNQEPKYQKALVLRYSGLLMTVCRRYLGQREMAKDVLQEALIKIFRALPNYTERGAFVGWMQKIVANTALQHLNKAHLKIEAVTLEEVEEEVHLPDIYGLLAAEELIDLIQTLPIGFRTVFNLYAIEGYSHREIAQLLDICLLYTSDAADE